MSESDTTEVPIWVADAIELSRKIGVVDQPISWMPETRHIDLDNTMGPTRETEFEVDTLLCSCYIAAVIGCLWFYLPRIFHA